MWWKLVEIQVMDLLGTSTILDSRTLRSPRDELLPYSAQLDDHRYPVLHRTEFTKTNLSGSRHIRYRVFPVKTPAFMITVQWVTNPLYTYTL
jgi:hypothetical protein